MMGLPSLMRVVALRVLGPAAPRRYNFAAGQEIIGHRDGLVEQSARIVTQVEHITPEGRANLLLEIGNRRLQARIGLLGE